MSTSLRAQAEEMRVARRRLLEQPQSAPSIVARHYMSLAMEARTLDHIAAVDSPEARELVKIILSDMAKAHREDFGCEPAWSTPTA